MSVRVLVPGARLEPDTRVDLPEDEARHLVVRRLRPGEPVVLLDGAGRAAEAALLPGLSAARVVRALALEAEAGVFVRVLVPCAEVARVEWAVEKGTECGAGAFLLVRYARSQRAHAAAAAARLPRLGRIAAEAVKQCGRSRVPPVEGPVALEAALEAPGPFLLAEPGAPLAGPDALAGAAAASVAVGPEGGLTSAEREAVRAAGGRPFGLGPRVLRLETAVVAALTRLLVS